MGKRDRRRRRERAQAAKSAQAARTLFPDSEHPLVEVHIQPGTPDDVRAMCLAYWGFTTPGTWDRPVSVIGPTTQVYKAVRGASSASLLTVLCPECTAPVTVTSRSEMAASGHWGPEFPLTPVDARTKCTDCSEAAAAARRQEVEQGKQREQERTERRLANASKKIADQRDISAADENPDVLPAIALLAMTQIMETAGSEIYGPLDDVEGKLTGTKSTDGDVIRELFQKRWIVPTLPATLDDFTYADDDTVNGIYLTQVPWRLAYWMGETASEAREYATTAMMMVLLEKVHLVREVLIAAEARMAVDYLNGLLTRKYNEEPIPEHRLPDAFATAQNALADGFTLEQMIAVAWSSAAGSVAWGQRTPGLKPGSVSSAAVTNLERRIGYAKDRPVDEYDIPNWVPRPAIRSTARRLLEEHEESATAMSHFRSLHQRVNSRSLDAVELDDDLADSDRPAPRDWDTWMAQLQSGAPTVDTTRSLTFAAVAPDGSFEIQTTTLKKMKSIAGDPYDMVERLPLDGTQSLDSFVAVFADHTVHPPNQIATRMIEMLGGGYGPVHGTVVFFQTGSSLSPRSLDDEHQQLVTAAHRAATAGVR